LIGKNFERTHRYVNIFDDMDADWEAIVNVRDTTGEIDFIQSVLSKKGTILDICCGTGRHSIILRQRGWNTVGLDISKNLLAIAKRRMKKERVGFPLVRADMRRFPFRNQVFDAVICMFTSFGYLPSEVKSLQHNLRLYTLQKLKQMLSQAGLKIEEVYGSYDKKEFSQDSSRMLVLARAV